MLPQMRYLLARRMRMMVMRRASWRTSWRTSWRMTSMASCFQVFPGPLLITLPLPDTLSLLLVLFPHHCTHFPLARLHSILLRSHQSDACLSKKLQICFSSLTFLLPSLTLSPSRKTMAPALLPLLVATVGVMDQSFCLTNFKSGSNSTYKATIFTSETRCFQLRPFSVPYHQLHGHLADMTLPLSLPVQIPHGWTLVSKVHVNHTLH